MNEQTQKALADTLLAIAQRVQRMDAKIDGLVEAMERAEKATDAAALEAVTANHGPAVARSLQNNRQALRELASKPADEFAGYMPGAEHLPD